MTKRGHTYPGLWISLESGEGGGKGTQLELLKKHLEQKGFLVESGKEPGHTKAGEQIRKILQDPSIVELNKKTELLLYVAAGIEYFEQSVLPILKKGEIFISDRWRDSTKAYQGYGLGLDIEVIDTITKFSCSNSFPDITFLIDIDPEKGLAMITGNEFGNNKLDKIEARGLEYHKKVNEGYREIAKQNPERFRVIKYIEDNIDEMHQQITKEVEKFIAEHNLELPKT